jgi:hypothetical protein
VLQPLQSTLKQHQEQLLLLLAGWPGLLLHVANSAVHRHTYKQRRHKEQAAGTAGLRLEATTLTHGTCLADCLSRAPNARSSVPMMKTCTMLCSQQAERHTWFTARHGDHQRICKSVHAAQAYILPHMDALQAVCAHAGPSY